MTLAGDSLAQQRLLELWQRKPEPTEFVDPRERSRDALDGVTADLTIADEEIQSRHRESQRQWEGG